MYKNKSPNLYRPTFICAIVEVALGKYEVTNIRDVRHPKDEKPDNYYRYPRNMYFLVGTELDFGSLKVFKHNLERKISKLEQELGMGPSMEDILDKLDEFPQVYQTALILCSQYRQMKSLDFSNSIRIPSAEKADEIEPAAELVLN